MSDFSEERWMALEIVQEYCSDKAELFAAAYSFVRQYRTNGSEARMTEAELCGLAEAWSFLESADYGLFDNRDDENFYIAAFLLHHVRPVYSAGALDILLNKASETLHMLQTGKSPNPEDLAKTEDLLCDIIHTLTW